MQRGDGFIYFLRAGESGPVKIGFSVDPPRRIRELQGGHYETLHLVGLRESTYYAEQDLHTKLAPFAVRGEWYQPVAEVVAEIGKVAA